MIALKHPVFQTRPCLSGHGYEFQYSLAAAIERHLATTQRTFDVETIRRDFKDECTVTPSRQAYHSALSTLMRQGKIVKDGRGVYRHAKWS